MNSYYKIIMIFVLLFVINSCANSYKISTKETIKVDDYNIYTFRLCEKIRVEGPKRFLLCDEGCDASDILSLKDIQVREELYLLVKKQGNNLIYLTTKTDRSFDIEPDIFNSEAYKKYVFTDDIENVYFGIFKKDYIVFTNKNETLEFKIAPKNTNSCDYVINTLLSKTKNATVINNELVTLDGVYSVPIRFIKSERILAIKENKKHATDTVQNINLNGKRIVFKGIKDSVRLSQRRRLKYHPEF